MVVSSIARRDYRAKRAGLQHGPHHVAVLTLRARVSHDVSAKADNI
jgi:hypothetical protein